MNKVFEKIIEKLEEAKSNVPVNRLLDDIIKEKPKELGQLIAYDKSIKIVKQEAEQYNNGWIPVSEKQPEIDEAIAKYKEITNTDSNCPAHCNISCDKCVQESRQLVEWLEELKRRRDNRDRCIK